MPLQNGSALPTLMTTPPGLSLAFEPFLSCGPQVGYFNRSLSKIASNVRNANASVSKNLIVHTRKGLPTQHTPPQSASPPLHTVDTISLWKRRLT